MIKGILKWRNSQGHDSKERQWHIMGRRAVKDEHSPLQNWTRARRKEINKATECGLYKFQSHSLSDSLGPHGLHSLWNSPGQNTGVGSVMPDVRIPEREERRPPRQCNTQRKGIYCWLESGPLPQPTQWCRVREPWAPVSTHIYRVLDFKHKQWVVIASGLVTCLRSNFIGQTHFKIFAPEFPGDAPGGLLGECWLAGLWWPVEGR